MPQSTLYRRLRRLALFIEISTLVVANFHTGWAQSATQAMALYGSLPDQLKDPNSFASQITKMLAARKQHRIAEAQMLAVPPVGDPAVCVLVMRLPDSQNLAITALNYGRGRTSVDVDLTQVPPGIPASSLAGSTAQDIIANQAAGTVSGSGHLTIDLDNLSGKTVVVQRH